jgi:hypothetical protein
MTRLVACLLLVFVSRPAAAAETLDAQRIAELAAMLPAKPLGVGRPAADRAAWEVLAKAREFRGVVAAAEKLLPQPIPEPTDELYLEFSRNGNRSRYQRVHGARRGRLSSLILAECLEYRGRFLPAIEATVRATCAEKSWLLPAHDRDLRNFRGEVVEIDLASAATAWNLSTLVDWLGDRLSADVRKLVGDELERRTFQPFESYVRTGKPQLWWATGTNNWNAVCLAGVTGAALAAIEPVERRAFYAAAAERYIEYFLKGFTPDGYCSEGMGYWNYGFGNYISLAETLHQATGGRIDWLADPRVEPIAGFGRRMEILPGLYPAFADCHVGAKPDSVLMAFLSRRFGWGLKADEQRGLLTASGPSGSLFELGLHAFPNSASVRPAADEAPSPPQRDWFPDAGILICRPAAQGGLAAALKGGHNAEHHNHNDVGSFVVALGRGTPLVDPGGEVYTARTFSGRRYESNLLNSFGHPVPRIAGQLQQTGRKAAANVLQTEWTDVRDTMVLDIRSAYAVKGLEKLQRTFRFSRDGKGALEVVDEVQLAQPEEFETALITFDKWTQATANQLKIGDRGDRERCVQVDIDTGGLAFTIRTEEILEDRGGAPPTRLAIALDQPVRTATVRLTIRTAP